MNEFKVCNKCKGFNFHELITKLKNIDESAKIIIGCQSMCAVGAKKPFVIVNGIPIVGDNIDLLIDKIKEVI